MRKGMLILAGTLAILLLLSFALPNSAAASQWKLIDFQEASINYKGFTGARHPLLEDVRNELNLTLNTNFLHAFFFNNKVHSITDSQNFALVGWNFFVGVRVTKWLDIQYEHYSRHVLDRQYRDGWFPYEDSIGIRLYLFRSDSQVIGPRIFE